MAGGLAAIPVPGLDFVVNLAVIIEEIAHYKNTFNFKNLDDSILPKLRTAELLSSKKEIGKALFMSLQRSAAIAVVVITIAYVDVMLPVVGSITSSGKTGILLHTLLSNKLEDFVHDANIVNDSI